VQYEAYLRRRKSVMQGAPLRAEVLLDTEIEKFVLIRDTIRAWLHRLHRGARRHLPWHFRL
jgi:hypothetical protein